jgi:hypothetical protein
MNQRKINHFTTFNHCSIIERVNRTIKTKMFKMFAVQGNYKYLHKLQKIIKEYNNSFHRSIQMKPCDVNKRNEKLVYKNLYKEKKKFVKKTKFVVSDVVRISKMKSIFEKGLNFLFLKKKIFLYINQCF